MDADILRLILFIAGLGLILGIYFWDRHKKINERVHAIRRAQQSRGSDLPEINTPEDDAAADAVIADPVISGEFSEVEATEPMSAQPARSVTASDDVPKVALEQELEDLGDLLRDERVAPPSEKGEQVEFSFSAEPETEEESVADLPELILQINLKVRKAPLTWQQVVEAASEVGLEYGDMQIYHRHEPEAGERISFSMANMVNPGTFPPTDDGQFRCPGVTLFSQLPGPKDGMAIFSDMLFTAERLASLFDAQLQDEHHSDLSKQTIEHIRAGILEHRRQLQLAKKRA